MFALMHLQSPRGLTALMAGSAERPACSVSNYPEYATRIEDLSADQRRLIRTFAQSVMASLSSARPVRAVIVAGHADVALRMTGADRLRTELEVSTKRAESAADTFLNELAAAARHPAVKFMIRCQPIAMGSANLVVKNAQTEADMRKNRRVEFFVIHEDLRQAVCACGG